MLKFLVAAYLIAGIIASVLVVLFVDAKLNPPLCDTCRHLKTKGGGNAYCYYCKKRFGGYDFAPQYCSDWESREKDGAK